MQLGRLQSIILFMNKKIFMIAGPNGSGKTTVAVPLISNLTMIDEFINADEIARGLAPMHPESVSLTASKLMLKRFKHLIQTQKSFAFETTASGKNYVNHLRNARANGYEFHLIFLWLDSPDLAVKRVTQRVVQGGHHVPEETIRRRYHNGLKNLVIYYLPIADSAWIFDNSTSHLNKVIAKKCEMNGLRIEDVATWKKMEQLAYAK